MFRRLLRRYRNIPFWLKLAFNAFFSLLCGVAVGVTDASDTPWWNVSLITFASLLLLDTLITRTVSIVTGVMLALSLFAYWFMAGTIFDTIVSGGIHEFEATVVFLAVIFSAAISLIGGTIIASKKLRGRLWVHIILINVFYVLPFFFIPAKEFSNALIVLFPPMISVAVYLLLRKVLTRKYEDFPLETFPNNKKLTVLREEVSSKISLRELKDKEYVDTNFKIFGSKKGFIFTLPISGENKNSITLNNDALTIDGEDFSWVLEYLVQSAARYSKFKKISAKNVTPVMIVSNINLSRGVSVVKVRAVKKPDKVIGNVLIVKSDKLDLLVSQHNDRKEMRLGDYHQYINSKF